MSDISIPGVSGSYNTQKLISDLMEAERIPLERMESEVQDIRERRGVWQEINRSTSSFLDSAKQLFGFDSPFRSRTAVSSSDAVLTATASRSAIRGEQNVLVRQTATADRFLSKPLNRDYRPPAGDYQFNVGEREVRIPFSGGNLQDLANQINKKGRDIVSARVINDTSSTQVILIESQETGRQNRLQFSGDAKDFGLEAGIIREIKQEAVDFTLKQENLSAISRSLSETGYSLQNEVLSASPGAEIAVDAARPFSAGAPLVLEYQARRIPVGEDYTAPQPPPGPQIGKPGDISYEGITIENEPSQSAMPPWEAPETPKEVDTGEVLYLGKGSKARALPEVEEGAEFQTYRVELKNYQGKIESLSILNRNTNHQVDIKNLRVYDPSATGDYSPVKPLDTAGDAIIEVDGVEIRRSSNTIEDAVPGVTLNINQPSDRPVNLEVKPDTETIKDSIITFVGYYNRLQADLTVLTRRNETVLEDISYQSDEELQKARDRLGMFQGNPTLNRLKTSLQRIMMNPYPTDKGRDLSLLAHIGISTNATGTTGTLDTGRLRGYLEIDEPSLDSSIESNLTAVQQLFGNDTDGDKVIDNGVAYTVEQQLRPYTRSGGILAMRTQNLNNEIKDTRSEIADYKRHLEDYEQELKVKYGKMEGALNSMQENSKAIENLNNKE
ncbi:MAG: flagellar filament capping protein FliD [Spirochaetales bacterium]|nr:flagellar filament capping protein FliD [Spirochaetales bacterium]MCF7937563.1 flagellar filament capping protein FliD [Spirochaetales bacterium]